MLFGIATAAIIQIGPGGEPSAVAYIAEDLESSSTLDDPTSTDDPPTTTEPVPFIYRVGLLAGVTTDNFWAFYGEEASVWNGYILGPTKPALYTLDPSDGSLRPEFAADEAVPIAEEQGWSVTIPLNKTLAWSDGEPITAGDMVFTFETARALGLGGSWAEAFPNSISTMSAIDDFQLRIEFADRPTLGVWPHGPGFAPIMPAHVWRPLLDGLEQAELYALGGTADVGGGPLALATITDSLIKSVANPGYPSANTPDVVEYHIYKDESDAVVALGEGHIDSILSPKGLTDAHLDLLPADSPVIVETSPANGIRYLGFNLNRAPMSDPAFRSSLALLLDREGLAASNPSGGSVAHSFVSESNPRWFDPEETADNAVRYQGELGFRLEKALNGLREAGYSWTVAPTVDGQVVVAGTGLEIWGLVPAPLTILTSGDAYDSSRPLYAAEIAETLGWLGFEVRPVETDFDSVVDLTFTPGEDGVLHYDMYLLGWSLGSPALPGYYRLLFAADGVMNNTGYSSDTFAKQLETYESSYTFDDARAALWTMESTLAADLPYLLLYTSEITEVYRSDRVVYGVKASLGGIQGRLGGIGDVSSVS